MRYMRDDPDHYDGTPSVGGTMHDEFKYVMDDSESRHRAETPSKSGSSITQTNDLFHTISH